MKPRKHAELIKAWADGADIQFMAPGIIGEWIDCVDEPRFLSHYVYRIKPELPDVLQPSIPQQKPDEQKE